VRVGAGLGRARNHGCARVQSNACRARAFAAGSLSDVAFERVRARSIPSASFAVGPHGQTTRSRSGSGIPPMRMRLRPRIRRSAVLDARCNQSVDAPAAGSPRRETARRDMTAIGLPGVVMTTGGSWANARRCACELALPPPSPRQFTRAERCPYLVRKSQAIPVTPDRMLGALTVGIAQSSWGGGRDVFGWVTSTDSLAIRDEMGRGAERHG